MNLNQVTIYTDKPLETVEFYQKLGLKIIVNSPPRYARLECPNGESTLSVHETNETSQASNIVLYFECDNLDEEVKRLKKLGLEFVSEPIDQVWLWRFQQLLDLLRI